MMQIANPYDFQLVSLSQIVFELAVLLKRLNLDESYAELSLSR